MRLKFFVGFYVGLFKLLFIYFFYKYSIQHYMIKFVSDLRQVGLFLRVLLFLPLIKLTAPI